MTVEWKHFLKKANKTHKNKYQYKEWENKLTKDKIKIICFIHGEFKQSVDSHLSGNGCPMCRSSKGELKVTNYFNFNNIDYIRQYKVKIENNNYCFDFYLPDYKMFIEYDGVQHFKSIEFFGGDDGLKKTKHRDRLKSKYASEKGATLIRIPYYDYDEINRILDENIRTTKRP